MTDTIVQRAPPSNRSTGRWVRENLFSTWYNTLLSLVMGGLLLLAGVSLLRWVFFTADWTIVQANLTLFMVGRYPRTELWRIWVAGGLIAVLIGLSAGAAGASAAARAREAGLPHRYSTPREWLRRFWPLLLLVVVVLQFAETLTPIFMTVAVVGLGILTYYLGRGLPGPVRRWTWGADVLLLVLVWMVLSAGAPPEDWGGLQLNLFLTAGGIALAFPIGLLFALARRSSLPVLRTVAVTYIELVRGVPLITLLLFGAFALGFLLPPGSRPDQVTRALIAITLFEGAYIAEVVRGGLQSVPKGQIEAALAVGLSNIKTTRLIVLPQALRAVIPAMVGQFISLYKDTSLVVIVGLLDILRVSSLANSQPEFLAQGLHAVTLAFVGVVFWVGAYAMSRESRRVERRLGVGER